MAVNLSRKGVAWIMMASSILLLSLLTYFAHYSFSEFLLKGPRLEKTVQMPVALEAQRHGGYTLTGFIYLGKLSPKTFEVIPSGYVHRLEINGKLVNFSGMYGWQGDVKHGFTINLANYLKAGENRISIDFNSKGGPIKFEMRAHPDNLTYLLFIFAWFSVFAGILMSINKAFFKLPRFYSLMYLLVIAGSILQVWTIFTYNPVDHIFSDPARHWDQGISQLRIDIMSATDPIMYQLFIGAFAKITLKVPELVAFLTSLMALITPWIWYKFFRELQASKGAALAGWAFLSLLPSWMSIYSYFMQETLMLPLLGASLWATWRCRRKGTVGAFSLMIFLWIITGLTRGIAIPFAAVCATWLWFEQDNKFRKAIFSSTILLLILGPLTYRSYHSVSVFAPHGMAYLNVIYALSGKKEIRLRTERQGATWLHGFSSPSMGTKPFAPFSDWKTRREGIVHVDIDLDEGMRDWDREMEKLDVSTSDYIWMTKENLIYLMFSNSWPDNNPARFIDRVNRVSRFMWAPLLLICIVLTIIYRKRLKNHWLIPSLLLSWFAVQGFMSLVPAEGRYRKPFEGLIIAQFVLLAGASRGLLRSPLQNGITLTQIFYYFRPEKDNSAHDIEEHHQEDWDQSNSQSDALENPASSELGNHHPEDPDNQTEKALTENEESVVASDDLNETDPQTDIDNTKNIDNDESPDPLHAADIESDAKPEDENPTKGGNA